MIRLTSMGGCKI